MHGRGKVTAWASTWLVITALDGLQHHIVLVSVVKYKHNTVSYSALINPLPPSPASIKTTGDRLYAKSNIHASIQTPRFARTFVQYPCAMQPTHPGSPLRSLLFGAPLFGALPFRALLLGALPFRTLLLGAPVVLKPLQIVIHVPVSSL